LTLEDIAQVVTKTKEKGETSELIEVCQGKRVFEGGGFHTVGEGVGSDGTLEGGFDVCGGHMCLDGVWEVGYR
jgi:hypothetical protein